VVGGYNAHYARKGLEALGNVTRRKMRWGGEMAKKNAAGTKETTKKTRNRNHRPQRREVEIERGFVGKEKKLEIAKGEKKGRDLVEKRRFGRNTKGCDGKFEAREGGEKKKGNQENSERDRSEKGDKKSGQRVGWSP